MKAICVYFLLFFIYSFLGWILEVSCKLVSDRKFINRGFLIGPYCPIYGFGTICITLFLKRYWNDPFTLFIMMILVCSILEYSTSYFLEKIFKTRWWDYSQRKFNINGRICLETMIPFGLLGFFIMYVSNPFILNFLASWPENLLYLFAIILFFAMIIDASISIPIMASLKQISSEVRTDSTEKITLQVKKEIKKRNILLQKRLLKAFPKLTVLYSKKIARKKKKRK